MASNTAAMYSRGDIIGSQGYNHAWSNYMNNNSNFHAPEQIAQQKEFNVKS